MPASAQVLGEHQFNHDRPVYPNLARNMMLTGIDQLWVADITCIRLEKEFVYLALVLDVYSPGDRLGTRSNLGKRTDGSGDRYGAGTAHSSAGPGASF